MHNSPISCHVASYLGFPTLLNDQCLRLIHQISHDVMIHIADRLALGLLGLLRMQQLKVEVLIPLLAEADEHRRGQPLVTAASLTIVDSAPKGHHFNKMWTACRQLVLTNIERFFLC